MTDAPAEPLPAPHQRIDAQAPSHDQIMANRRRLQALAAVRLVRPKVHGHSHIARHALTGHEDTER